MASLRTLLTLLPLTALGAAPHPQYRTEKLCVLAGAGDHRAPGQERLRLYGTDLGVTFKRGNVLEILFGDTWSGPMELSPDAAIPRDDAYGTIDLTRFPDGDAVEAYCDHGKGAAPPIRFGATSATTLATVNPGQAMDGLRTPVTGFATADRPGAREIAIMVTGKPLACATDTDCAGYKCDTRLGIVGKPLPDTGPGLTLPCVDGQKDCQADPLPGKAGLCRDPGSSLAAKGDDKARVGSAVWRQLVGARVENGLRDRFTPVEWPTNRFINVTAATVRDVDFGRRKGNDYRTADGQVPAREGVFLWGRPNWTSVNREGHNLQLYLAYVPMIALTGSRPIEWRPRYFTGVDGAGRPRFSDDPMRAAALDLSGGNGDPRETYDVAAQASVRWIAALGKWVMFYGGGIQMNEVLCAAGGGECRKFDMAGASIRMRTADHPWGPWSLPRDILFGGHPDDGPAPGSQYAPGGLMHHPDCKGDTCATNSSPPLSPKETGSLYGANLIPEWTEIRKDGAVDLYWNVSSWAPYRVTLMKTRIEPDAAARLRRVQG